MLAAVVAAALLFAPAANAPAPLDAAACEAIPGAPDEGPRFKDSDGVFSLSLPSSWVQKDVSSDDVVKFGDRAVFDLRQGDLHRLLIARLLTPTGTRAEEAAHLAEGKWFGVGNVVTHAGAPCTWVGFQGVGHARKRSLVCDLTVKDKPARFVLDLIYLDTDTCDHSVELHGVVDTLKWGAGVSPGAH